MLRPTMQGIVNAESPSVGSTRCKKISGSPTVQQDARIGRSVVPSKKTVRDSGHLSPNSKLRMTLGRGKAALTLFEEMLSLNRQAQLMREGVSVLIFAPSDGWWGLRAGRSGSARGGYRVLTIGGEHAEFPLDPRMGARIADLADAVRPVAILVEVGELTVAEQQALVADFAERSAMSQVCRHLHLVFDEAEDYFPTSPVKGPQLRAARALDSLVRKRRARGIAVTMVTSRLANLRRNVTSQTGRFFLFGISSPQDLGAADELVRYGRPVGKNLLSAQVARLAPGEAIHLTHGENPGQVRFRI